ncbi:DUF6510 family protein [Microbacterium chocolatum]|uniref:DUF6510 family protein n=1 Tax=Microbacterium aurantiacum TaxID=162393 RepID=UPI00338F76BC
MISLDGSALAGALADVFGRDVSAATCRCTQCGDVGTVASTVVYATDMGMVARCRACSAILLTLVTAPGGRRWFGMPGIAAVELPG